MKSTQKYNHQSYDQSFSSNKENDVQDKSQDITNPKLFSTDSFNQNQPRHRTFIERKPFSDTRNKTTLEQNLNSKEKTRKLADIHVQSNIKINKNHGKQKQPLKLTKNEDKSQIQNIQKQIKKKITLSPLKAVENCKKQVSYPLEDRSTFQNETPSQLIKQQLNSQSKFDKIHNVHNFKAKNEEIMSSSRVISDFCHVMKPIKQNCQINHIFNRHQSCILSEPVSFHLPTHNDETLNSSKISRFSCSEFRICLNKRGEQFQLGTLKSNFQGSVYNFYPQNTKDIYFSITFKTKNSDFLHKFRHSQIYINQQLYSSNINTSQLIPTNKIQSLEGLYIINSQQNLDKNQIIKLQSQQPTWNRQKQCYGLNFGVKQLLPSVKNTIFVDENGKQIMKFYKNDHHTYEVSFINPLSWIIAYAYALASTDFKIATQ